jgi:WD40 repeat protein
MNTVSQARWFILCSGHVLNFTIPLFLFFFSEGGLTILDERSPQSSATTYQAHARKLNCVSFHAPSHQLATASLDFRVRVFDIRKMQSSRSKTKEPTPLRDHLHGKSVSSAYFDHSGKLVTTSKDDTIRVFSANGAATAAVKHNCNTGRWVRSFFFFFVSCVCFANPFFFFFYFFFSPPQ